MRPATRPSRMKVAPRSGNRYEAPRGSTPVASPRESAPCSTRGPSARLAPVLSALLLGIMVAGVLTPATAQSATGNLISGVHLSDISHDNAYAVTFGLEARIDGTRVAYTTADGRQGSSPVTLEGEGAPIDSVWVYSAGIPTDTVTYTIRTTPDGDGGPGARTFTATPRPAADAATVRIGYVADQGSGTNAKAITDALAAAQPGIVLHGGDIAYASSGRGWDNWFAMVEPIASRVPWMPAVGNHDAYDCTTGGPAPFIFTIQRCGLTQFRARFTLPEEPRLFHSFDWGPVHVIIVDTEAYHYANISRLAADPPTKAREQEEFLAADLAAHRGNWTIVVMHRPPYSSSASHGSDLAVRAHLAPILEAGGADLVLTGHDHMYERSWALRDGAAMTRTNRSIEGDGTIYVVGGGSGADLYTEFMDPMPEWSAFRRAVHEFVIIDATRDRLDVQAIMMDGRVVDAFSIQRAVAAQGAPPEEDRGTPLPGILLPLALLAAAHLARRNGPGKTSSAERKLLP